MLPAPPAPSNLFHSSVQSWLIATMLLWSKPETDVGCWAWRIGTSPEITSKSWETPALQVIHLLSRIEFTALDWSAPSDIGFQTDDLSLRACAKHKVWHCTQCCCICTFWLVATKRFCAEIEPRSAFCTHVPLELRLYVIRLKKSWVLSKWTLHTRNRII